MLHTTIARVDEADVPRLREWLASLNERREELLESYRTQGTIHEQFFLVLTRRMPILVLITELENVEEGTKAFLSSKLPIDVEFKSLYQGIWAEQPDVELLYDSSQYLGDASEGQRTA